MTDATSPLEFTASAPRLRLRWRAFAARGVGWALPLALLALWQIASTTDLSPAAAKSLQLAFNALSVSW